jgi:hypothetical protein
LTLLIGQDSHIAIKGIRYGIFKGLSQGTVKVLRDPETEPQQEERATMSPESVSEREEAVMSTPPGTDIAEWRRAAETIITPAPVETGTPMERTWSANNGEKKKEKGMETDPSPSEKKE